MNATRINLLNGQSIETADIDVLPATHRAWNVDDMEQFPQAEKSLAADIMIVVDRRDGSAWAISCDDAAELEMGDLIELDGGYVRASAW